MLLIGVFKLTLHFLKRKIWAVETIPENVETIPTPKLNTCFLWYRYTPKLYPLVRISHCKNNAAKNFKIVFQIPCWGWGVNNFDRRCYSFVCVKFWRCVQFQLLNNFEQQEMTFNFIFLISYKVVLLYLISSSNWARFGPKIMVW